MNKINDTIDKMHKDEMINFEKKKKSNINDEKKMYLLQKKINKINTTINNNCGNTFDNFDNLNKLINDKAELILKLENIKKTLEYNNLYNELQYYDKSIDILTEYYDIIENNKINEDNKIYEINNIFKDNIIDNTRSKLHTKYIKNIKNINTIDNKNIKECINPECNNNLLTIHLSNGYFSCMKCGYSEEIIIEGDKSAYKELSAENSVYAYKRINHFNEWLSQFQGKESTEIPEEIYNNILIELKKERITDYNTLKNSKMRKILKNLGYNKYYEHIPHILSKIGKIAPKISREMEEELREMFKKIQVPFNLYCPKKRKNFLSYSYTLHKFCELLNLHETAILFPMLKSREKLKEQDALWKNICKYLEWEFIPSI